MDLVVSYYFRVSCFPYYITEHSVQYYRQRSMSLNKPIKCQKFFCLQLSSSDFSYRQNKKNFSDKSSINTEMNYRSENHEQAETGRRQKNIISRLEGLRVKMRSLEESMQRERTLIDNHIQAASYHVVKETDIIHLNFRISVIAFFQLNWPHREIQARYYQAPMYRSQQQYKGAYERYLDDVMQMCHAEEERLQSSMYDLRKVRRDWRDIDCNHKEQRDEEASFNNKHNFSRHSAYCHSRRNKGHTGDSSYS